MKIYGFPLSPFVRKVVVSAREKGLDYELIPANPSQPTEEFLKVSPFSKIPAIADGTAMIPPHAASWRVMSDWRCCSSRLLASSAVRKTSMRPMLIASIWTT